MRRAGDHVALVQIIRPNSNPQKFVHQFLHGSRIVIDASQEDGLPAERDAGIGQPFAGGGHLRCNLLGVVDVNADVDGMKLLEHCRKRYGDPLRQKDWNTAVEANNLDVRNRPQPCDQLLQLSVTDSQRVPAGHQHIANFGMGKEVVECRFELVEMNRVLDMADDPTPRAKSARESEEGGLGLGIDE